MDELYYIYKKDGSKIRIGGTDAEPKYLSVNQLQYDGTFLGQSHISFTLKTPIAIPFEGQEYLTIDDEKYTLKYVPSFKKQARPKEYSESFVYDNIIMQSQIDDTTRVDFLDYVLDDSTIHYSAMPTVYFYGTVIDLAKRIQANLDRVYTGDKKWTIKLPTDTSSLPTVEKQIMYQNKKVWDAITDIWNQYKVLFYSRGTTLYIGYSEETIGNNFKYGIGKGLKSLERKTDESNAIITRLHAYGSKVNLPSRYYNTLGTTVKPNLPITIVGSDGVNRQLWFKVDDVTMDMFKDSTDFSYTGTGPTNPTDPKVDVYVTKTVTFTATKKQISTTDGVCLFVDCNSLGWSYADYRWLYWAMYKGGNTVTVLSSVVVSSIPNKYLYNANVYASDSMYLPNLMLPLIRTNSDTIKYYDASFNEITDSTKAYYRMVRTGNNSKGLDIYIDSIKGIEKYGVMEGNITFDNNTDNNIIDLVDDENGICPTITKLSTSTGSDASKIVFATQLTDSGIPNSAGSLDVTTFVVVVNVGFNPNNYPIVGETAQISMKSGTCIGRTFDFNCAANTDGTYTLTCNRIVDSSMQIGFPNAEYNIKPDDTFVFLGIQLPEEYIVSAENRLLSAGLKYISKFDHTKNIYAPELDNIFLENNKNVRKSILAGNIFQFIDSEINGVDNNNEGILIALPISQSTVKIGYSMIREYSITLAENIDIKTNSYQRTLDSVKDYFTSNIENIGYNQIGSISYSYVKDKFLSKEKDDRTEHSLGVGGKLSVDNDLRIGSFRNGLLGSGALIDAKGNAEFDSITARTFMAAKSFLYNLIEVNIGERWSTNGFCKIKSVDTVSKIITEELDENQYSSMQVGDGCRAIYCDIDGKYTTSDSSADNCGFPTKKGFFTSYFMVSEIVESGKGYCSFRYALRNSSTPEPCALMQAAQYFSFTNENRRSSIYECNYPHSYIMTLEGVSTWEIQSANIVKVDGWLNDISITLNNGNTTTLSGKGLYVQDNVYLGNAIIQLDPMTLKDLQDELNNYTVDLDCNADLLQVDANGNVVGGLWKEETSTTAKDSSGNAIKYKQYLIHSAIYVKRNGAILIEAEGSDDASEGTYKVYMTCDGCTAELHNSTIYLTCINGVHDGVASTTEVETDEWYKAMLKIDHVSVTVAVDCEGKGTIAKTLNLPIKHINDVMALADLTNETTNIVFSKKQSSYVGFGNSDSVLTVKHGTELMTITEVKFGMVDKVTSTFNDKTSNITFSCSLSDDTLSDSFSIPITVTALYKGISYERTIQKKFIKIAGNTSYELSPSVSAISASYDATGVKVMSPTSVSCGIKCYDDTDGNYVLSTDKYSERKLAISYIVDSGSETAYTGAISTTSTMTKLIFVLKMSESEIDRETIYVNADGKPSFTYIRYATNLNGYDMQTSPDDTHIYIGVYTGILATAPNIASAYTWMRWKGDTGEGTKGDNGYVHIAWCNTSDNSDNSFTISNTDGKEYAYIGTYTDNTASDSTTFSTYTWVKVKGEKGDNAYIHIRYSADNITSSTGASMSDTPSSNDRYIGILSNNTATASTTKSDYVWSLFYGQDGSGYELVYFLSSTYSVPSKNANNKDDVQNKTGYWYDDPQSTTSALPYLWVSQRTNTNGVWGNWGTATLFSVYGKFVKSIVNYYLASASGSGVTKSQITSTSVQTTTVTLKYLWTWQKTTFNDGSSVETDAHIIGTYGDSAYLHIKFAKTNDTTKSDMSDTPTSEYKYIGLYTDNNSEASTTKSDYIWSAFFGQDGDSYELIYFLSNSSSISVTPKKSDVTNTTGGWYDDPQSVSETYPYQYVSQRTKTNGAWSDFSVSSLYNRYAKDGTSVTVVSNTILYQASNDGENVPTGTWYGSISSTGITDGMYLWTRTVVVYSSGSPTTTYTVGRYGKDGIGIKSTVVKYARTTSSIHPDTSVSGNWTTDIIYPTQGYYLHVWVNYTYTDNSSKDVFTSTYSGIDGESITGNPGHNVWFRTSEWQPNTDYYDGKTALNVNGQYLYPLDYISVTDNNNQTASYYYCSSRHTSGDTFDVRDGWSEMSSMGALYAPLAWFNKALINYIQAQKALFGNMVLDAMGANNPNMIPCTYSGSKSVWHYDYGSHNGAGVFVINYNSNGYGQIYSGYGKDITLVAGHTYTISAKARTLGSSTPHTIRLFVLNYVYRDGQYRENYYVVNDGTSYSGYYAPKFDGNNWYITINGTNHYITNYTPSYGEWHAERMNIYPSDGWITIKKTFIVSQNTAYQWDGMHVKIRLDLNDNSVTTDYAEIKDLKLEEGESVTADDHVAEMLGYVSQQDMQSRLGNQATLIEGGYIRTTLIKAINVVANKIYAEFGEGIPAVTINSDNDGAIKQYWTGTNQPRLIIKDGKISWYKSDGSISKEITEDTANAVVIYNSTKPGTWTYIRLKDVTSVVMKTTNYGNVTDGILYAQWVSNNDYTGENASQYKSADGYIVKITWADNNLNPPITSADAENLINGNFIRNGSALWIDGAYRRLVYDITRSGTSQTITTRYELVGDTTGDVPSIGA